MISVYWQTGLLSLTGLIIFGIKLITKKEQLQYHPLEVVVLYFFAHIFPLLMLEDVAPIKFLYLLADFPVVLFIYLTHIRIGKEKKQFLPMLVFYLLNPLATLAIAGGKRIYILMMLILAGFICILYAVFQKKLASILNNKRNAVNRNVINNRNTINNKNTTDNGFFCKNNSYCIKDYIAIFAITLVGGILIFWKIGVTKSPVTEYRLAADEPLGIQLILDFGRQTEIGRIDIYLGKLDNRLFTISAYDEETSQWLPYYKDQNVNSVFCWNSIECPMTTRYLGIASLCDEAYINELVVLDKTGRHIRPKNADGYGNLFDEEELYPLNNSYYYGSMFDEVYHARTAYEIINNDNIYEYTHPQLGKIIMATGIKLFGMTPFGWRFMCAVFGILMLPVSYIFSRKISGKTWIALFTSVLFLFDFMHYTLSRIGTIDIITGFFIMLMFLTMFSALDCIECNCAMAEKLLANRSPEKEDKKKLFVLLFKEGWRLIICGMITGLCIACKWTGIYAACGLMVAFVVFLINNYPNLSEWKRAAKHLAFLFFTCILAFGVIPLLIYVASFVPYLAFYDTKNLFVIAYEISISMFDYHKGVMETHPYMSEWYEWIWMKRPLLDAYSSYYYDGTKMVQSVATFGNPVSWFVGTIGVFYNVYLWRCKKDPVARYLTIFFLSMLLPWLLVQRTVFIYQYFGCVIIMTPLIANMIKNIENRKILRWFCIIAALLAAILFILFFPEISGISVSENYIKNFLEWLPGWTFA